MKRDILEDEDPEYTRVWFEHVYAWNRLLDSANYLDYKFMNLELKRVRVYAALLMLADGQWTTADEVDTVAELGSGDMDELLLGLHYMKELDVDLLDDGSMGYQLTRFGKAWAAALVAEYECL